MKQTMEISDDAIIFNLKDSRVKFDTHLGYPILVSDKRLPETKVTYNTVDITHVHAQIIKGSNLTSNN